MAEYLNLPDIAKAAYGKVTPQTGGPRVSFYTDARARLVAVDRRGGEDP